MKVSGVFQSAMVQAYKDTKKKIEKSPETVKSDSLQISAEARNLQSISGDTGVDNSSKIEALKNQIKQGTYHPNPALIAKKMIGIMQGSEV